MRVLTTPRRTDLTLSVMGISRTAVATGLFVVASGIAALGVSLHYGIVSTYGDISDSTLGAWRSGLGIGAFTLVLAGIPAVGAAEVAPRLWTRLLAAGLLALIPLGMLAVTPAAQRLKLDQYDATPQCVSLQDMGPGPGTRAQRESQRAFESIQHVGYFGGGGGSGVGGCDRTFTLTEDVNVLQHYRTVLPDTGWQVVEDDADHLRAERDAMAFEVAACGREGVVWAGEARIRGMARCHRNTDIVTVPSGHPRTRGPCQAQTPRWLSAANADQGVLRRVSATSVRVRHPIGRAMIDGPRSSAHRHERTSSSRQMSASSSQRSATLRQHGRRNQAEQASSSASTRPTVTSAITAMMRPATQGQEHRKAGRGALGGDLTG